MGQCIAAAAAAAAVAAAGCEINNNPADGPDGQSGEVGGGTGGLGMGNNRGKRMEGGGTEGGREGSKKTYG